MQRELGESYEALLSQIKTGSVTPEKVRDVTLIPLVGDVKLVIACDSNASIGEKKNDYYKNAYEEVAVSAMKVPLMEVLATGAVPVVVVDNLCMETFTCGSACSARKAPPRRCAASSKRRAFPMCSSRAARRTICPRPSQVSA